MGVLPVAGPRAGRAGAGDGERVVPDDVRGQEQQPLVGAAFEQGVARPARPHGVRVAVLDQVRVQRPDGMVDDVPGEDGAVTGKDPSESTLIGRPTSRVDALDAVTGRKKPAMDLDVPDAPPTMVRRPPAIDGTVESVRNTGSARADAGRPWRPPHGRSRRGRRCTPARSTR